MEKIQITDVRAHPGDSAFLIDDGTTAIMYDSGFAFTGFRVAEKIKNILGARELDYIFLTHSHYDHALGAAYALKFWPDAKVVAGEYASKIFSKPTAKAVMRDLDKKIAKQCNAPDYEDLTDDLRVDIAVKDGDKVVAGDLEFITIDLPGHTKCSVGYYCPKEKLLLSCETIGVYNGEDDVVPSYLVGYDMSLKSIEKVQSLDIENILIPHYGMLDGEKTKLFLKKAEESAASVKKEVVSMLRNNKTKEEIVGRFKERFYYGYIKEIYPIDAMELNTGIMIDLLKREFLD